MACRADASIPAFDAVLSLAAFRLASSRLPAERVLPPWYALTAIDDAVYPSAVTHPSVRGADEWREVKDDHDLEASGQEIAAFMSAILRTWIGS